MVSTERTARVKANLLELALLLLLGSCTGDTLWHRYVHIAPDGWKRSDTLTFNLPAAPTEGTYFMDIELRTTPAFPYQQLYVARLVVSGDSTDSLGVPTEVLISDTICIHTSTNGRRLSGEGVTMHSFSQQASPLHFLQGQQAQVRLHHIMSRGTMPEITDIGIRIQKEN